MIPFSFKGYKRLVLFQNDDVTRKLNFKWIFLFKSRDIFTEITRSAVCQRICDSELRGLATYRYSAGCAGRRCWPHSGRRLSRLTGVHCDHHYCLFFRWHIGDNWFWSRNVRFLSWFPTAKSAVVLQWGARFSFDLAQLDSYELMTGHNYQHF